MDTVSQALSVLESTIGNSANPPAIIVLPPDSGKFIVGNRDGFIRLAVASLKAAQGEEQPFKRESWVSVEDLDWGVAGLKPDDSAHIYLRTPRTRLQRLRSKVFGFVAALLLLLCLLVGFCTIVRWIFHLR